MSSTAIIALTDPRRPEAGTKRFKINGSELSTVLSKYYRRKIAGIYDEADRVYYPLGFIKLDSSYFESIVGIETKDFSDDIEVGKFLRNIVLNV